MKCRAVLGFALAPVVETGSGDVGMAEPFLDLGDVGPVLQSVRPRRRPHRMHAESDGSVHTIPRGTRLQRKAASSMLFKAKFQ